jgi:hypothetical protein
LHSDAGGESHPYAFRQSPRPTGSHRASWIRSAESTTPPATATNAAPPPASDPPRRELNPGIKLLFVVLIGCAAAGTFVAYTFLRTVSELPDAYAKWDVGNLLIEYMETHDRAWPKRWEDLEECYTVLNSDARRSGDRFLRSGQSFAELQRRIAIDFTADPATLPQAQTRPGQEPFRIVWSLSGSKTVWEGAEPNEMILYYLKTTPTTRPAHSRPSPPNPP